MTTRITDRDSLKCYVYHRLGSPILRTNDLHNDQLDWIIDTVLERFYEQAIEFSQSREILGVPVERGKMLYDISTVEPQPTAVIDRISHTHSGTKSTDIGNILFTYDNYLVKEFAMNLRTPDILTFQTISLWMDLYSMLYMFRLNGRINEKARTITITPSPKNDGLAVFEVYARRPEEELYQYSWVQNMTFARALEQIGMNRIKYTGVALPGGGSLNGDMYLSRGQDMMTKLEEELLTEWTGIPDFYMG